MSEEWFILTATGEQGAFTYAQLKEMATNGKIVPDTSIKRCAHGQWIPASSVVGLFSVEGPKPPPIPQEHAEGRVARRITVSRRIAAAAAFSLFLLGLATGVTVAFVLRAGGGASKSARVEEKLEELRASSRVAQHVFPGLLPDEAYDDEALRPLAEMMAKEEEKEAEEKRVRDTPPPGPYPNYTMERRTFRVVIWRNVHSARKKQEL